MKFLRANFQLLFGLVLIGALTLFSVWGLFQFAQVFSGSADSVKASIIAASVGVATLIFTYWKERSRSIKEAHREKKIEVYSVFYDLIFELMTNAKADSGENLADDKEFQKNWMKIARGVMFYGSPRVVSAFSKFKTESATPQSTTQIVKNVGRILLAMRDDIGLSNWGLDEITIHQVYVREDLSTSLAKLEEKASTQPANLSTD